MAAMGNTAAIRPFSSSPVPIAAAMTALHSPGRGSSLSSARRKAHIASAMVAVTVTSGI